MRWQQKWLPHRYPADSSWLSAVSVERGGLALVPAAVLNYWEYTFSETLLRGVQTAWCKLRWCSVIGSKTMLIKSPIEQIDQIWEAGGGSPYQHWWRVWELKASSSLGISWLRRWSLSTQRHGIEIPTAVLSATAMAAVVKIMTDDVTSIKQWGGHR